MDYMTLHTILSSCTSLEKLASGPRDSHHRNRQGVFSITQTQLELLLSNRALSRHLCSVDMPAMFTGIPPISTDTVAKILAGAPSVTFLHVQNRKFTRKEDAFIEHQTLDWIKLSDD